MDNRSQQYDFEDGESKYGEEGGGGDRHYNSDIELIFENFEKLVESRSLSGHSSFHSINTDFCGEIIMKFYLERGLILSQHLYLTLEIVKPSNAMFSMEVKTRIPTSVGAPRIRGASCKCTAKKPSYVTLGTVPSILREAELTGGSLKLQVQLHLLT